jgi:hypothetical protein
MTTAETIAPSPDPILDELHRTRRRMLAECDGDLEALVAQLRKREQESGHPLTSIPVSGAQEPLSGEATHHPTGHER